MPAHPSRSRVGRAVTGRSRTGCTTRIIFALVLLGFAYFQFMASTQVVVNPYTGEQQRLALSPQQELALGLQAVPQMVRQHGGKHPDQEAQARVERVGRRLAAQAPQLAQHGEPISYPFEFHLLADEKMINAFALPGGQIFITAALLKRLENEDQLAGVLGHEIGHVIARHSNEQMSKAGLLRGVGGAVGVLVGGDSASSGTQVSGMVNHVLSTRYGRGDEYESDEIGAILMQAAGYNPEEILGVMKVLQSAGGGGRQPEMMSTHPYPENRAERLKNEVLPRLKR